MSDNVSRVNFDTRFNTQVELESDLQQLIEKYEGQLSLAQFIGVLEIVKHNLLVSSSVYE